MRRRLFLAATVLLASVPLVAAEAGAPDPELAAWRAARLARLTAPDGWLSLIGLHWLAPGESGVGSAGDNAVVLAAGPAHWGAITVDAAKRVQFSDRTAPGGAVQELAYREGEKPTLVVHGTVSFFVIERGGRLALRVKDSASARRREFAGIGYFPADPAWRIEAGWVPFAPPREVPITNILGQTSPAKIPGKAVFTRDGRTFELLPIDEGAGEPLFFVIADATSGAETYGAARFVYAEPPRDGKVILDFNRAQNPPCAFTPFATCPLPPKENRLPFRVTAGEQDRGEAHH